MKLAAWIVCAAALCVPATAEPEPAPNFDDIVIASQFGPSAFIMVRGEQKRRWSAPISATAIIDPAETSIDDLIAQAPGLAMINDQDPGTNIISLRGVTTDRLQQAAIAFVVDGVPLADTELFTAKLFDVSRIDVLRGPQGALFGKNAAGGAIEVTNRSTGAGAVTFGLGNGAARSFSAAGDVLNTDDFTLRVAGLWTAHDGWIKNRTVGRIVDGEDSRNLRVTAKGNLGPVRLEGRVRWMEESGGAAWASSGNVTGSFNGVLDGAALTDPIGDYPGASWRRWLQGSVRASMETKAGDFALLLARDSYAKRWDEELDYRPGPLTFFGAPIFPNGLQPIRQPTDIRAETVDLNWRRDFGVATVKLGAFGQNVARTRLDDFGPLLFGAPAARYDSNGAQRALYGALGFDWGDATLDLQARLDHDQRRQIVSAAGAQVESRSATFERLQPRIAGSVRLTDDVWLYASYGEGFRSGGFNPIPAPTSVWRAQFAPEITRSGEIGARGAWGLGAADLSLEASLFRSEIANYQNYTFLDAQSVTLNVDRVEVAGGELLATLSQIKVADGRARLEASYALADSRIARFIAPDPLIAGATRDYSGKRVPNAPQWTSTVAAVWERSLFADGWLNASLTLNATGETFYEIDNALRSPSKSWLDAQLSVERGQWTARLWGRNITDRGWAISAFGQGMLPLLQGLGPGGPFDTFTLNRGRQFGVELTRSF